MKNDYVLVHVVDDRALWFWSGSQWTSSLNIAKTYEMYVDAALVVWLAPDQMMPTFGWITVASKEALEDMRYQDLVRAMTLLSVGPVPATAKDVFSISH